MQKSNSVGKQLTDCSFTISSSSLHFTKQQQTLKLTVKNACLRTTSYEIVISDTQHFQLASPFRSFSLAPGISKQVAIKHIQGKRCSCQDGHIVQGRVRDFHGKWNSFECRCPMMTANQEQDFIDFNPVVQLGQFDQKASFDVQLKNNSEKNLKIIFEQRIESKICTSQTNILVQDPQKKLVIKNMSNDSILLMNQKLRFHFQLNMSEHGQLQQRLNFKVIAEEPTSKFLKLKKQNSKMRNYSISVSGFSVSKKLIIKDESQQTVSQIRSELLTGTSKASHFYIQTQYHQDMPYVLEAYFETKTPQQYTQKWKHISIKFSSEKGGFTAENKCEGILKSQGINRIDYRIDTRYSTNDENYVAKYSKIQFEDDLNALRMRNSDYSKKYQGIQVKITVRFANQNRSSIRCSESQNSFSTVIPFKFTVVNPSLRCQVVELEQSTKITIMNETKINIPFSFPMHSLYRIQNKGNQSQFLESVLQANSKQIVAINWTKSNERCSLFMEIPSYDIVLYETRDRELKNRNMIVLPPSRRRPQTAISTMIKAKQKQNGTIKTESEQLMLKGAITKSDYNTLLQKTSNLCTNRPSSVANIRNINPFASWRKCANQPIPTPILRQKSESKNIGCENMNKKACLCKDLPKFYLTKKYECPQIQELQFLVQQQNVIKNTHVKKIFVVDVIGYGYIVLSPGQFFVFDGNLELARTGKDVTNWGSLDKSSAISYRILGHSPIYSINLLQTSTPTEVHSPQSPHKQLQVSQSSQACQKSRSIYFSNIYQSPCYQILTKQIKMSFKQSKQQFEIIEPILIKNISNDKLEINCISIDSQFFKCKEPNGILVIGPGDIGEFRIGFQPENTVRLSLLNKQPPKEKRRKAVVKSNHSTTLMQDLSKVSKQIKLLINKNIQTIICTGETIQKTCSVKPYKINLTNCKYGSPQIIQTMVITNTSTHKINFIIENPTQISIRPKSGVILPKSTQNCTITFKPCKKISNLEENVKIFIGGSHLELVPVLINVEDPQIFIKEHQLLPCENAICGAQLQQLNIQMTIINNNPTQSFIEINLLDTPLSLGYTKNYHSANSDLVMQNFTRCSQIIQNPSRPQTLKAIVKSNENSIHSIMSSQNFESQRNIQTPLEIQPPGPKICSITVSPNSFLIVPITLRVQDAKIGLNSIKIEKNIASLVGFGQIKSPHVVKYNCNKTLLHISPHKQFHEIILTQSQKNYQISLKNMAQKTVSVRTKIKQLQRQKEKQERASEQDLKQKNRESGLTNQPSIVCTFKDINENIKPDGNIDLNMSFICFQAQKKKIKTVYQLAIYVKQNGEQDQQGKDNDENQGFSLYFTTIIDVVVPEPFLEINPSVLVMPTVPVNSWSRESFVIKNNGYKQIFFKLKKPANIAFQFECQILNPHQTPKQLNHSKSKMKAAAGSNFSSVSIRSQDRKSHKTEPKFIQNQLTKMKSMIEVRVSFRSKTSISFKCILQVEDNFNNNYQLPIVGTCTDSPFFASDIPMGQYVSAISFSSYSSFNSQKSLQQGKNGHYRKNTLQPTDIEDLLFLNSWIGSLIPEISNQSKFFYVWLTKVENFTKFLKEFNIKIKINDSKSRSKSDHKRPQEKGGNSKQTLTSIFQTLKQQGFQLNSLRVQLLEKADQLQWLNFMWFFLTKAILASDFLPWLSKSTSQREAQEITYGYVQKNFQQMLTIVMSTSLQIKKQNNNNKAIDWKYLIENFQPLFQNFKHVQSMRHLILSLNIFYHKLRGATHQILEICDFQFVLSINNTHNRRVRYFLQCKTDLLTCEQSSNKVLPAETSHGYSFIVEQNQQIDLLFSLKNCTLNALTVITKSVVDLIDIIMYNNTIWDPITVFHVKLKRKDDIVHHVNIECENGSSQQWTYSFEAKISAEYRVFFENQAYGQYVRLLSGQPGFLKKGDITNIRVLYSPESMNKSEATLRIANTMMKEVFLIHGKPLHSSKMEHEKNIKIIKDQQHEQVIIIPWENVQITTNSMSSRGGIAPIVKNNQPGSPPKLTNQKDQRISIKQQQPQPQTQPPIAYILKLFNPSCPQTQPTPKYSSSLLSKTFSYNPTRKQLTICIKYKFQELVRNLQQIYQISSSQSSQSKLIRFVIDVVPKPIIFKADIQTQFGSTVMQSIRVPNLGKIAENVIVEYCYVGKEEKIGGGNGHGHGQGVMQNAHKGLFQVIKIKNGQAVTFNNSQAAQKPLQFIELNVKYSPNETNCFLLQQQHRKAVRKQTYSKQKSVNSNPSTISNNNISVGEMNNYSSALTPIGSGQAASANSLNNNSNGGATNSNSQLPNFLIILSYVQSLYKIYYLFVPNVKKITYMKATEMITDDDVKLVNSFNSNRNSNTNYISHTCIPLTKYSNNIIYLTNDKKHEIKLEVQTDLYEISGLHQITIKSKQVYKFTYDIYALHLGKKQGKITFKLINSDNQKGKKEDIWVQYNVCIDVKENDGSAVKSGQDKLSNGLKIHNQKFEISSTIRKGKLFSIKLSNMSQKQIQYQLINKCEYLHLHLPSKSNHKKSPSSLSTSSTKPTIKIAAKSQYQLQILYIPFFVGTKQTDLCLYNPYQPEITYHIVMHSEDYIQDVSVEMSKIGEWGWVEIPVLVFNEPIQLELTQFMCNNKQILMSDVQYHVLVSENQPQELPKFPTQPKHPQRRQSESGFSLTNQKVSIKMTPTPNQQSSKHLHHHHHSTKKIYLLFNCQELSVSNEYFLVFSTQIYGIYSYRVRIANPAIQVMPPTTLYLQDHYTHNCENMLDLAKDYQPIKNGKQIDVQIVFTNRFNEALQMKVQSSDNSTNSTLKQITLSKNNRPIQISSLSAFTIPALTTFTIKLGLSRTSTSKPLFNLMLTPCKNSQVSYSYPITIYKVFQTHPHKHPIVIVGQARLSTFVKVYPLIIYNCQGVSIELDPPSDKVTIVMKNDIIRERAAKQKSISQNKGQSPNSSGRSQTNGSVLYQNNDRVIPIHRHIRSDYLYEVMLEVTSTVSIKQEGYLYLYQSKMDIASKNITPAATQKHMFNPNQHQSEILDKNSFWVQKIPFVLKIDPPKIQTLYFDANVGEKATIKIKLSNLSSNPSSSSNKSIKAKSLDNEQISELPKIQLHNNKSRQFSAIFNQKQQCIEVSYLAKEYSNLKRGKIQITIDGVYSQYELIGRFKKSQSRKWSGSGSALVISKMENQ